MLGATPQPGRWPAPARPERRRQGGLPGSPDAGSRAQTQHIRQAQLRDTDPELGLVTIAGIAQHDPLWHARGLRLTDLVQGDRRLGREGDLLRHARLGPADRVGGPGLGQIELIGNGQAGLVIGYREADRHLAVVPLAQHAAVLPGNADRMRAVLGEAGVIDNPVQHRPMPLDPRQPLRPPRGQHRRIVPVRLGHHVVQRLMFGLHMCGVEPRRHRLDALALAGQQQAGAVGLRRGRPARMPQHTGNRIQISRQPRFARQRLSCSFLIHHPYMGWLDKNNTVRLGGGYALAAVSSWFSPSVPRVRAELTQSVAFTRSFRRRPGVGGQSNTRTFPRPILIRAKEHNMEFDSKSVSLAAAAFAAAVALPLLASAGPAPAPPFTAGEVLWRRCRWTERLPDRDALLRGRIQAGSGRELLDLRPDRYLREDQRRQPQEHLTEATGTRPRS